MSETIREPVQWFAEQMELKLRTKDKTCGSYGWRECRNLEGMLGLWRHLREEVEEAETEIGAALTPEWNRDLCLQELVDIANLAMMLADNLRSK